MGFVARFITLTFLDGISVAICFQLSGEPSSVNTEHDVAPVTRYFKMMERLFFHVCASEQIHGRCIKNRHRPSTTQPPPTPHPCLHHTPAASASIRVFQGKTRYASLKHTSKR